MHKGPPTRASSSRIPTRSHSPTRSRRTTASTNATAPVRATLYNLIETVFFLASSESPGLQFADLAAYALWRLVAANDDRIARTVAPLFDREPLTSRYTPGKWHGIKFLGNDPAIRGRLGTIWA